MMSPSWMDSAHYLKLVRYVSLNNLCIALIHLTFSMHCSPTCFIHSKLYFWNLSILTYKNLVHAFPLAILYCNVSMHIIFVHHWWETQGWFHSWTLQTSPWVIILGRVSSLGRDLEAELLGHRVRASSYVINIATWIPKVEHINFQFSSSNRECLSIFYWGSDGNVPDLRPPASFHFLCSDTDFSKHRGDSPPNKGLGRESFY